MARGTKQSLGVKGVFTLLQLKEPHKTSISISEFSWCITPKACSFLLLVPQDCFVTGLQCNDDMDPGQVFARFQFSKAENEELYALYHSLG